MLQKRIMHSIENYVNTHYQAKKLGGQYIYQNEKAQQDAIELMADILDLYALHTTSTGYAITDNGGLLEIQRVDEACIFEDDEQAVAQAIKDGIKIIPINELPKEFPHKYLGWIDTQRNRQNIQDYCDKLQTKKE